MKPPPRQLAFPLYSVLLLALFLAAATTCGCISPSRSKVPGSILSSLPADKAVAVSLIHEECSGNITQLGNRFRDDIEIALKQRGHEVKPRKDLVLIIDDAEISGNMDAEQNIWKKADAGYVVSGCYSILREQKGNDQVQVRITTKAYNIADSELSAGDTLFLSMKNKEVQDLSGRILGNIFQNQFKSMGTDETAAPDTPFLEVRLDQPDRCYRSGQKAAINIRTEKGVYLYLFCLSCDGNVTLLHPNAYHDNVPLETDRFIFPPAKSPIQEICLMLPDNKNTCRETFKIIVSRSKLDFSFLPFPENEVYQGFNGPDINKIAQILSRLKDYTQRQIHYRISTRCP